MLAVVCIESPEAFSDSGHSYLKRFRVTKKPPDGRLEHLVAGAGFEPTASGL